jgi:hypothetical protein
MTTDLERFVLPFIEGRERFLNRYGDLPREFRVAGGEVAFSEPANSDAKSVPVQLLGTACARTRTWLWAWANPGELPSSLLRAATRLRETARAAGQPLFASGEPIPLARPEDADELAVIAAGALGCFAYLALPHGTTTVYVAVESPPPGLPTGRDVALVLRTLEVGIGSFAFDHQAALLAYLGPPMVGRSVWSWPVGELLFNVHFDDRGRVVKAGTCTNVRPRTTHAESVNAPPTQP